MRRLILLLFILFMLAACSNNNQETFTLPSSLTGGNAAGEGTPLPEVPRVEVTPTPPLPPTFTPEIMAHQGHLYLLPVSGADGSVQYVHIVRPGETLSALSKFYGVSVADVARVNHIADQNLIEVGAALVIPIDGSP